MRVPRNHQATLDATRASSEGEHIGGAGECGVWHPEEGSAWATLDTFPREERSKDYALSHLEGELRAIVRSRMTLLRKGLGHGPRPASLYMLPCTPWYMPPGYTLGICLPGTPWVHPASRVHPVHPGTPWVHSMYTGYAGPAALRRGRLLGSVLRLIRKEEPLQRLFRS